MKNKVPLKEEIPLERLRVIETKDLMLFKKIKIRAAQKAMQRIKDFHEKEPYQLVTNEEAALYYDVKLELFEHIIASNRIT